MSGGKSSSSSSSQVDPAQAPFLQFLREQGQQTFENQQGAGIGGQEFFDRVGQPLSQQGAGALETLGGITGGTNPFMQALASRAQGGNPELDAVIAQTQGDIQRNLEQNVLPSIGGAAAGLGQRGGARQGVAEGIATEAGTNLRFQDFGQQGAALSSLLANQQAGVAQTFPALGGQFGLQSSRVTAPFLGLESLRSIFQPPVVLGQGKSSSFNFGF